MRYLGQKKKLSQIAQYWNLESFTEILKTIVGFTGSLTINGGKVCLGSLGRHAEPQL